jgi:hypothetical protein
MDKSHVSLEQKVCPVCGQAFDSGSLLLDRRLLASMEHKTITGWAFCPDHQKLRKDGYVALVGIDESKSEGPPYHPNTVWRTGEIMHIRGMVLEELVNIPVKNETGEYFPLMFVDPAVIEKFKSMMPKAENDEN